QKALAKRTEWNKSDAEFLKRRNDLAFRIPPEKRVLALQSSHGLNCVRAPNALGACFGQTKVLHLALLDEILHSARDILNGDIQIDAVLIEEIQRVDPKAFQRSFSNLLDVLRPAVQCRPLVGV